MSLWAKPNDNSRENWGTGIVQQLYRMGAAALVWFAIVLQYAPIASDGDLVAAAIRFLSYFTDLSNVLVTLATMLPWLARNAWAGRFITKSLVRPASTSSSSSSSR